MYARGFDRGAYDFSGTHAQLKDIQNKLQEVDHKRRLLSNKLHDHYDNFYKTTVAYNE
jgi:hypothetical protein